MKILTDEHGQPIAWPAIIRPAASRLAGRSGAAKVLRDQSGQAAMFGVVCLLTVMGVMALAVDVGNLRFQQQRLQTVADTAAMAGALEVSACGSTSNCSAMQGAARSAVVQDGLPTPTGVSQCGSRSGL